MELLFKCLLNGHSFLKVIIDMIIGKESSVGRTQWRCALLSYEGAARVVTQPSTWYSQGGQSRMDRKRRMLVMW